MVPRSQRQEALSRAYVKAIAAMAGVTCTDAAQDFGIDQWLRAVEQVGHRYTDSGDQLDVQVRSTIRAVFTETEVLYDLDVRTYDLLRKDRPRCPRILVVVVFPDDEDRWMSQSVEELIIRRCAYWRSFRGAPAVENLNTVRVPIPRTNVFSVAALRAIMKTLSEGGDL
jgi:hypothetical protein